MSAFKYQWNQTIDVGTAGLSKQWTSIRHILSLLVTANACVHVTAYVAVRRSLSTTYTAVVLGLLLRQYVSYQFGVWAGLKGWMKCHFNGMLSWEWHDIYILHQWIIETIYSSKLWRGHYQVTQYMISITPPSQLMWITWHEMWAL